MTARIPLPLIAVIAVLCAVVAPLVAASSAPESTERVILKWRDTAAAGGPRAATATRLDELRQRSGRPLGRGWNIGGSFSVVQLDALQSGRDLASTLAALRADPDIALAVPDERVKAQAYTPNDPLYSSQWYLQGTEVSAIRANDAWDITRGGASASTSTVVVAVIDSGVRFDHPDLAGKLLPGWDFVSTALVGNDGDGWDDDPSDPGDWMTAEELASPAFRDGKCGGGTNQDQPTDSSWHGTRVAGMIAAASDNAEGMTGAAFNVRVLPLRVLGKCGGYVSDVIAAMYWAAGMSPPPPYMNTPVPPRNSTPAKIINLSLGSETPCSQPSSEVYRVAVEQITAHGSLIVASAGNSGTEVGSPAGCEGVLAVAGLRQAGTKVGYSSLGAQVSISAPAGNCVNIGVGDPCLFALNSATNFGLQAPESNGYSTQAVQPTYGTSFSSPLAAATAALMLSVNPGLSPRQLVQYIKSSARPFPTMSDNTPQPAACVSPSVTAVQNLECICTTEVCGAGMLDAGAAVLAAQGATPDEDPPGGGGGSPESLLPGIVLLWLMRQRRKLN